MNDTALKNLLARAVRDGLLAMDGELADNGVHVTECTLVAPGARGLPSKTVQLFIRLAGVRSDERMFEIDVREVSA